MQIEKTLHVSAEEFYRHLLQSAQHDIEQCTEQKIAIESIEPGFSYKKTLKNKIGKEDSVTVTLTKLGEPLSYEAEFKGTQGMNIITYRLEKIDESTIKVLYQENFKSDYKLKSMNYKIMKFFYKRSANKRIKQLLNQIQNYIIENRNVKVTAVEKNNE